MVSYTEIIFDWFSFFFFPSGLQEDGDEVLYIFNPNKHKELNYVLREIRTKKSIPEYSRLFSNWPNVLTKWSFWPFLYSS